MQMRDAVRTQGEHTRRAGLVGAAAFGALMLAGLAFVLLENHSFDNVFGRFPGADGATAARSGTQTLPLLHAPPSYWHDIFHEYGDATNAIDKGKMDGFSLEAGAHMNGDR